MSINSILIQNSFSSYVNSNVKTSWQKFQTQKILYIHLKKKVICIMPCYGLILIASSKTSVNQSWHNKLYCLMFGSIKLLASETTKRVIITLHWKLWNKLYCGTKQSAWQIYAEGWNSDKVVFTTGFFTHNEWHIQNKAYLFLSYFWPFSIFDSCTIPKKANSGAWFQYFIESWEMLEVNKNRQNSDTTVFVNENPQQQNYISNNLNADLVEKTKQRKCHFMLTISIKVSKYSNL